MSTSVAHRRPESIEETAPWQAFHAFFFLLGGVTFIVGTAVLFYPDWADGALVSAVLYTVGR